MARDLFGKEHCTPGHEDRCMNAKSEHCDCQCGGINHGNRIKKVASKKETRKQKKGRFLKANGVIDLNANDRSMRINGIDIDPKFSQSFANHSPDGFNWGYGGSGPAQLALAILLELTNEEKALNRYQDFKREVIANMEQGKDCKLEIKAIRKWLKK
jgi:hypothetical protein